MVDREYVISGKKSATLKQEFRRTLIGNILGWIVYVVGAFADSIIGGATLGEEALAAIEIITPIASIIYFVGSIVSVGSSLLHAKYVGQNDFKAADRVFSTGLIASVFLGVAMSAILFTVKEAWLDAYELEGVIREYASQYYDPAIFLALIMPIGAHIYNGVICDGDSVFSVIADVAQTVINIVLSLVLVESLGIFGLSLATLIASAIYYIIPCGRLFTKYNTLHFKFTFSFKDIWDSIKMGSSSFLAYLAIAVIDIIMNYYITIKYGASFTAPYAIVNFALEITGALSLVGQTMITGMNFSIGEDNRRDIKAILSISIRAALLTGLCFSVIFIGLTPIWPELFGLETEEFINYTTVASITIGITFIPQTFLFMANSFYNGFNKIGYAVLGNTLNSFICPLVFPIAMSLIWGFNGFVVGFAVSNIAAFIILGIVVLAKNKKLFAIPNYNSNTYSIDLLINPESISDAVIKVRDILEENKISSVLSNRVQITIEESMMITLSKNKKKVSGRIVIDINEERIKIIEKDTGTIFNEVNPDQRVDTLSNFVFVMATQNSNKAINYVATNLNGNHYEFNLK